VPQAGEDVLIANASTAVQIATNVSVKSLTVQNSPGLTLSASLTTANGFYEYGGALNFNSGSSIQGGAVLTGSQLTFGTNANGAADFTLRGNTWLAGNVAHAQHLWVQGSNPGGNA